MRKKSSSGKRMSNVRFLVITSIILLVVSIVISALLSDGDADDILAAAAIAVIVSLYITMLRILKYRNDPEKRLGNWNYFFLLSAFISGIMILAFAVMFQDGGAIILAIFFSLLAAAIIAITRGVKYKRSAKRLEKEQVRRYQERLISENKSYSEELKKKDQIISRLKKENSELSARRRETVVAASEPEYNDDDYEYRQEQRWQQEEDRKKAERLEDWYRQYVTIEVNFEYHYIDTEFNRDYWEYRSEDIHVSRREAMALIEAGEGAIIGRTGYSDRSKIRNVSYQVPFGLYDRPMGC